MLILFVLNFYSHFVAFFVYFLVFIRVVRYFGLHAATLILIFGFVGSPVLICVDITVLHLL